MTARSWPIAGLLLLAAGGGPVAAQQPAFLIGPGDKAAVRPGPGVEFGFFDPATGRFTPATPAPTFAAVPPPTSGTFTVLPDFRFDKAFGPLNSIFCQVTLEFGNVAGGMWFPNHTATGSDNFEAGDPDKSIPVDYAYTPNSDNARVRLSIQCYGYDNAGVEHRLGITYGVEDLPYGDVTRQITDNF
jgi:hypothetical protein